jgi:hypothetical protein
MNNSLTAVYIHNTNIMCLDIIHSPCFYLKHKVSETDGSIEWVKLSMFYLKIEAESSLRNVVF